MKPAEDRWISQIQANIMKNHPECLLGFCNRFISFPEFVFSSIPQGFLMLSWYLVADSLLAFKGALVTAIGIFTVSFLNMIYKDGRPFWNSDQIQSYNHCVFSFASPSMNSFNAFFFCSYKYIMSRKKYAGETSTVVNYILIFFIVTINVMVYIAGVINGLTYLYQSIMGTLTGFVYLVIVLTFDKEIHRWCEKAGFIRQSSRVRKFNAFFGCLGAFVLYSLMYMSVNDSWDMP